MLQVKEKVKQVVKVKKQVLLQIKKHDYRALDNDDWDDRPEYICKACGYHKKTCVCKK